MDCILLTSWGKLEVFWRNLREAERWRIYAFELWCWRRLLCPSNCKKIKPVNPKGNQSRIFIGRTDAEIPILWPPDVKSWLTGKDPDAGKIEDKRTRGRQRMRWLESITDSVGMRDGEAWCAPVHGVKESQTELSNWTTANVGSSSVTRDWTLAACIGSSES